MSSVMPTPSVLFVASRGTLGGPNQSLLTLLDALDGNVIRHLAAPDPLIRIAESRGLVEHGHSLGRQAILGKRERVSAGLRLALWLLRHRALIDVIHANNLSGLNIAGMAGFISRRPTVVWSHTSRISDASARVGRLWRMLVNDLQWLAVSTPAADLLGESGLAAREAVAVVPNPINPSRYAERSPTSPVTVAYLGGPATYKGYYLVASVVEQLGHDDIRWHVVAGPLAHVTGDTDPATALLRKMRGPNVTVSGWLSAVEDVYARAGIVFCPSYRESFGMVAAEAMANGIPVVASDIPAFRELIGEDEAGILFPVGDGNAAAEAIKRLAEDDELRDRLGAAGKRRASRFDQGSVAEGMLEIYQRRDQRGR